MTPSHIEKNRRHWDQESDRYQGSHGATLQRTARAWGVWRIPESDLNALGDVRGKDVLELGCGGAQWSAVLAADGARVVGIDLSAAQLRHAREERARSEASFALVQGSAEELPFAEASFDLVFCDHGAMNFTDPRRTVPEVARVLRPGGVFAFSHDTPIHFLAWDRDAQRYGTSLASDYFDMRSDEDEVSVVFQLPYGTWLELFREAGLVVEDLLELRPEPEARTTYEEYADLDWARRWPAEQLWRLRKPWGRQRLVGVAEAAEILGWDKRRVATYARRGSFPEPVAELAGGRVWTMEDVLAFAQRFRSRQRARRARQRGGRPGRSE